MNSLTLGAWDSIPELRKLREHTEAVNAAEADRTARKEVLAEAFLEAASEGDVRAPCFFVRGRVGAAFKAPAFSDVLYGTLEDGKLIAQLSQLVVDSALGMPVQEKAAALLEAMAQNFAEGEV